MGRGQLHIWIYYLRDWDLLTTKFSLKLFRATNLKKYSINKSVLTFFIIMAGVYQQTKQASWNIFTNQILPKSTWDSLFESYNPFSTIAVSRVLQKKAHGKSKQIKQQSDKLPPFSLQNRTAHKLSIPWNWNISQSH